MIWFRLFLYFILTLWFQIKLPGSAAGFSFSLEMVFVSVVLFGATNGIRAGLAAGLLGGGLQDALSVAPLGFNLLVFSVCGAAAGALKIYYFLYSKLNQMLVVAIFSAVLTLYRLCFHALFFSETPSLFIWGSHLVSSVLWNGIGAFVLSALMKYFGLFPVLRDRREVMTAGMFEQFRHRMKENPFLSD